MNSYSIFPTPMQGREIGIFWDFDSFNDQDDFKMGSFAAESIQIANSIFSNGYFTCSKVYGKFTTLDSELCNIIRSNGYEICNSDGISSRNHLVSSILLWLWDIERKNGNSGKCCVVLVTNDMYDMHYDYILLELRKRSVTVATICEDASKAAKWNKISNVVRIFSESILTLNNFDNEKNGFENELIENERLASEGISTFQAPNIETSPSTAANARMNLNNHNFSSHDSTNQIALPDNKLNEREQSSKNEVDKLSDISRTFSGSSMPLAYFDDGKKDFNQHNRSHGLLSFENYSGIQGSQLESSPLHSANLNLQNFYVRDLSSEETSVNNDLNDQEQNICSNDEQRNLLNELTLSVISHNVQGTVSKLRKIYTRQFRGFRIPAILANISQQIDNVFENRRVVNYAEMTFILGCIQWCFGGQKGDNIDSFTYKMNKNIARWLLKDLQKKLIPRAVLEETISIVILTVQNILKIVTEFEYCLELLQFLTVNDPLSIITPQVYLWGMSSNPAQVQRAKDFALQIGIPPSVFAAQLAVADQNSIMATHQIYSNREYQQQQPLPPPPSRMEMRPTTMTVAAATTSTTTSSLYANMQASRQTKVLNFHQQVTNILSMHPNGLSAAQIMDIYYHESGRSLQVDSERLNVILQSFANVEVIGVGAAGTIYYRLKNYPPKY